MNELELEPLERVSEREDALSAQVPDVMRVCV